MNLAIPSIPFYFRDPDDDEIHGTPWMPSNHTEGEMFHSRWCANCERDKVMTNRVDMDDARPEDRCQILGESFGGEPKEWQLDKHSQPCCTAFVELGNRIPCDKTIDMFDPKENTK